MLCLHMAQFMGDGECSAESIVLADAAAPVWITHRPQLSKSLKKQEQRGSPHYNSPTWNTSLSTCEVHISS